MRAPGIVDDLSGVAGEISDRGVDLAERNLHRISVKQERGLRLLGPSMGSDPDQKKRRSKQLKYLESMGYGHRTGVESG